VRNASAIMLYPMPSLVSLPALLSPQLKFLNIATTQACISAAKSELLNSVVQCEAACLLNSFTWQELTWSAAAGSDIFGWYNGYPFLTNTQTYDPACGSSNFFDPASKPPPLSLIHN
jgi:hypothetical protein